MSDLIRRIEFPAELEAFLKPSRYKAVYGGRGSGKSHAMASLLILRHLTQPGMRSVCIREVQKSLKDSAKRLIEDKIEKFGFLAIKGWEITREEVRTPGNGVIIFQGMQDHTAESIKSLEGFGSAWVEEAQTLSSRSLELLRPTIRAPESEIWFSWNPTRASDPVDKLFRGDRIPSDAIVRRLNWNDNPWFPRELEQERRDCEANEPEAYPHIWEGAYAQVYKGAYFASLLAAAETQNRIGFVPRDPMLPVHCIWDIGSTSRDADATAIWCIQFVGAEVRVLDYYEVIGQPFTEHVGWLNRSGYGPEQSIQVMPHDGNRHDAVFRATPRGALTEAGFKAIVQPNRGAGAAFQRIEAVRRMLPFCRFHADTTKPGREALGWYHERRDGKREVGLGPEHDWSSHAADAFGEAALFWAARPVPLREGGVRDMTQPLRSRIRGVL